MCSRGEKENEEQCSTLYTFVMPQSSCSDIVMQQPMCRHRRISVCMYSSRCVFLLCTVINAAGKQYLPIYLFCIYSFTHKIAPQFTPVYLIMQGSNL